MMHHKTGDFREHRTYYVIPTAETHNILLFVISSTSGHYFTTVWLF